MYLKKLLDSDLIRIEASLSDERVSPFKYYETGWHIDSTFTFTQERVVIEHHRHSSDTWYIQE